MMTTAWRGALLVLLMLSAACGSSGPTSPTPTGTSQPIALPSPAPQRGISAPPLSGPSRTFVFDRELSYRVSDYTKESRFVLYDNGAFMLRFVGQGGEYRGEYSEADGVITFEWEGWSVAGPWGATGAVKGDRLTVQYNLIMQMTDFEDAVYALTR